MFKKISGWLKALFTKENAEKVRQTVIDTASASVNEFVNDPANQAAAREAVIAVAKDGLGGNAALDAAVGRLKAAGIAAGRDAARRTRQSGQRTPPKERRVVNGVVNGGSVGGTTHSARFAAPFGRGIRARRISPRQKTQRRFWYNVTYDAQESCTETSRPQAKRRRGRRPGGSPA